MRILGWDSETTLGYVKLLANSDGLYLDAVSDGAAPIPLTYHDTVDGEKVERSADLAYLDTETLLDFLFDEGMKADYNVFWNVKFDFGAIVKPWVVRDGKRLKANHLAAIKLRKRVLLLNAKEFIGDKLTVEERQDRAALTEEIEALESVEHFDLGKYRILYIPKKGFRITRARRQRGRNSVTFFDAMPWYATEGSMGETAALDRTARKHLGGAHKSAADEGLDVRELGNTVGYYEAHRDAILRYCVRDCQLTAALFAKIVEGFDHIGVPFPREPWSRASVGREVLKRTRVLEPTRKAYAELMATGASRLWVNAYAGACILVRGVGSWPDVTKFDANSAYPAAMAEFPSLDGAYIVGPESPEFDGCFFQFYEVDLVPTPRRALREKGSSKDHLVYVEGGAPRRVCVTGLDLELFDAWGDQYTVVKAIGIVTPSPDRPLAFLTALYDAKTKVKEEFGEDSVEYQNVKIPMNGIYGILTQSRPREGRFTNFIYGAYITARCRRDLWLKSQEVTSAGGTVLAHMTDGLLVAGLEEPPAPSKALGAWDVKDVGLVTIFANGLYVANGKLKKRGAPDLKLDDLMEARRPWVHVERTGPLGLKEAIIQGRPEDVGVWETEAKDLVPWRMVEDAGLRMVPELRSAPLRDYFSRRWFLDHRDAAEPKSPASLLEVAP